MKWTQKPKSDPMRAAYRMCKTRTIEKFLIFPRTIQGETRWWEKAQISQRVRQIYDGYCIRHVWSDVSWADSAMHTRVGTKWTKNPNV